jgi:hypothetical protein
MKSDDDRERLVNELRELQDLGVASAASHLPDRAATREAVGRSLARAERDLDPQITEMVERIVRDGTDDEWDELTDDDLDPLCDVVAGTLSFALEKDGQLLWRLIQDWRRLREGTDRLRAAAAQDVAELDVIRTQRAELDRLRDSDDE